MINRGINASAGMLIINPNARNTSRIGLSNEMLSRGSIHYVGSEIRAIILSKMKVDPQDDICVIGGESIAIEAALIAAEGSVIAVEYSKADRSTLEDNVSHFDLHNIRIIDHVDEKTMEDCPIPSLVFLVASASTEQELMCLKKLNPNINAVIYTLDFKAAAALPDILLELGFADVETIQVSVNKLGSNNTFKQSPAPWIMTARGNGK
jgi:precorrin-6Y C5,15-methyltransferase (decarboxylating)